MGSGESDRLHDPDRAGRRLLQWARAASRREAVHCGGHSGVDNYGIKTAYTYDASGGWFRAADMRNGRWYPSVLTLASGEMLAISGGDTMAARNVIPEVYQPTSNTWRSLTSRSVE